MSQINNSQPYHPVITFKVNLQTVDQYSYLPPDEYQSDPDTGRTDTANQALTRSTWVPGLLCGENIVLNDSNEFTLYGMKAQYLSKLVTQGIYPFLSIVSQS